MLPHLREGIQRAGNRPGIAHAAAAVRENRQKKPTAACGGLRLLPGHTPRESAHGAAAEGMLLRKFRISVQLHKPVSPKAVRTAWIHPPRPQRYLPDTGRNAGICAAMQYPGEYRRGVPGMRGRISGHAAVLHARRPGAEFLWTDICWQAVPCRPAEPLRQNARCDFHCFRLRRRHGGVLLRPSFI